MLTRFCSEARLFFLMALVAHWYTSGCWCITVHLTCQSFQEQSSHLGDETATHCNCLNNEITKTVILQFFMSEVVAHHTAIALISPHLKTMRKRSTGKHRIHLLLERCRIHFTELKLESNYYILLRLWHLRPW